MVFLTGTPAAAIRAALSDSSIGILSEQSGVPEKRIRSFVDGTTIPTAADREDLSAIGRAIGRDPRGMGYQAIMRASPAAADGSVPFVMSTDSSDRYNDVVEQDFDLKGFLSNPVAPWAHNYAEPPIGKWVDVSVENGRLQGRLVFDESPENDRGRLVASQYRNGFLSAVSVGFLPQSVVRRSELDDEDPNQAKSGFVFGRNILLECSAVVVPGNNEATAIGRESPPETKPHPLDFLVGNVQTRHTLSWLTGCHG